MRRVERLGSGLVMMGTYFRSDGTTKERTDGPMDAQMSERATSRTLPPKYMSKQWRRSGHCRPIDVININRR
jgi:hypothetical protein